VGRHPVEAATPVEETMNRTTLAVGIACVVMGAAVAIAQTRAVPRAPLTPGPPPQGESAAPDGYAPVPQWLGQTRAAIPARRESFTVETVISNINALNFRFLPDGRFIIAQRDGRIQIASADGKLSEALPGLPANLYPKAGQNLFDVQPDRNFATNRTIYFTYAVLPDGVDPAKFRNPTRVHVGRARISADGARLEDATDLLDAEGTVGRVVQAADGTLFVTSTAVAGFGIHSEEWPQPQQLDSLMGQLLRINADGSIPKDNPFVGKPGARAEIYALGFRDDQGLAIHPRTGVVWASEHGPRGGDEINAIEKGKNYGFPVIGYGRDYNGKAINHDKTAQAGMEQPVYFWTPDIAPSGIAFYTGRMFPAWDGNLFVAALAGKHLARLVLNGNRVIAEERLLEDQNARMRAVHQGPDGALYVLTDGANGKILRLKK
jgi:glucose/arabinose dehydrogenase